MTPAHQRGLRVPTGGRKRGQPSDGKLTVAGLAVDARNAVFQGGNASAVTPAAGDAGADKAADAKA